ncbi:TetR/AcrR family transcriptional regulator [Cohnella zeiphila]|uniref:TetR/AcrR family transcriptional regulator n=1 Tax=Cohnella zeiphila TaxID=2761120 RepID=A0A7X0VYB8_9BACL|nr:TetR/AcrR family transcriptional regulator [Cohnella zeiphila]MBB6735204.1 TetR/AcrR family transcriptional regulator [Cohnella zeiphila]
MSPRTKQQNEEIRKQRKREILQAAVRVYAEKGYAASDMGEIADRAGLSHGLVYYYFKNKKTLFRELYETMNDESEKFTRSYFEQDKPAFGLFQTYARLLCEGVLKNPAIPRFHMRISLDLHHLYSPEEFSPFEWARNFLQPMACAIEKAAARGEIPAGDAGLAAMQFWGSVSQGMNYLDQMQQDLDAQGTPEADRKRRLDEALNQVVESSVALLRPQ